jgi:DnaD/phage-associated family protein
MERKLHIKASKSCRKELRSYVTLVGTEVCLYAVDRALEENRPAWYYVRGILRNLREKNIRSRQGAEMDFATFHSGKGRKKPSYASQFQQHGQTQLTDLERKAVAEALAEGT